LRVSPAAERVIDILSFLGRYPDERFTVSELARQLDMNKATAHTLVITLAEHGFLLRHPDDKTYRLGPALVGLGESAALDAHEAADFAHVEMRRISEELNLLCVIGAAIGDEIVILARLNGTSRQAGFPKTGQRLPFTPPVGAIFVAWADPSTVAGWLSRGGAEAEENAEVYREHLRQIRARGFAVNLAPVSGSALAEAVAKGGPSYRPMVSNSTLRQFLEHGNGGSHDVLNLVAPVFHTDGRVLLSLNLEATIGSDGTDLMRYGNRLLEAAAKVTASIHGSPPENWPVTFDPSAAELDNEVLQSPVAEHAGR
jgi:DNA-binding IclR family transcriptional regulator